MRHNSEEDVIAIRAAYPAKRLEELAKEYGCTIGAIRRIITGRTHPDIPGAKPLVRQHIRRKGILTPEQVKYVRSQCPPRTNASLAHELGVSHSAIDRIVAWKTWRYKP
jgi:hypothetical protein